MFNGLAESELGLLNPDDFEGGGYRYLYGDAGADTAEKAARSVDGWPDYNPPPHVRKLLEDTPPVQPWYYGEARETATPVIDEAPQPPPAAATTSTPGMVHTMTTATQAAAPDGQQAATSGAQPGLGWLIIGGIVLGAFLFSGD